MPGADHEHNEQGFQNVQVFFSVTGDTARSRAMLANDSGEPTLLRSIWANSLMVLTSWMRENSSTSSRTSPSKYCRRQRSACSSDSARQGSGKPPRSSRCVKAASA